MKIILLSECYNLLVTLRNCGLANSNVSRNNIFLLSKLVVVVFEFYKLLL